MKASMARSAGIAFLGAMSAVAILANASGRDTPGSEAEDAKFEDEVYRYLSQSDLEISLDAASGKAGKGKRPMVVLPPKDESSRSFSFQACYRTESGSDFGCENLFQHGPFTGPDRWKQTIPLSSVLRDRSDLIKKMFHFRLHEDTASNPLNGLLGGAASVDEKYASLGGLLRRALMGPRGRTITLKSPKTGAYARILFRVVRRNAEHADEQGFRSPDAVIQSVSARISTGAARAAIDSTPSSAELRFKTRFAGMEDLYAGDVGVWEGYDLKEHTLRVLSKLRGTYPCHVDDVRDRRVLSRPKRFFEDLMALHDIGKPLSTAASEAGIAHGDLQHVYSYPVMKASLTALGYSPREVEIGLGLMDHDMLGDLARGNVSFDQAYDFFSALAKKIGLTNDEMIRFQMAYYFADAGAYPTVYSRFMQLDEKTGCLELKRSSVADLAAKMRAQP